MNQMDQRNLSTKTQKGLNLRHLLDSSLLLKTYSTILTWKEPFGIHMKFEGIEET